MQQMSERSREDKTWSLAELAEEAGVPPRTIRYYIARGLLEGPVVAGRQAAYTLAHMERLQSIRDLQSRGKTLAEIGAAVADAAGPGPLPEPVQWECYVLAEDVEVRVRSGAAPWRVKQIRESLRQFARNLKATGDQTDGYDRR